MLAYTFYESDGRVMRYAETLAQLGAEVDVIALRRADQPREELLNGVRVLRIQRRERNERGKGQYLARILGFLAKSTIEVTRQHLRKPYDLVHVHSVPDFEVFAALVPKLGGAKIILDIHDIVPEFYAAKFGVTHESLIFKILKLIEKASTAFADHVIIANDLWLEKLTARSTRREKCSAFINYPDLSIFTPTLRTRGKDGRFIMAYPGTVNWHNGLDIAVKALGRVRQEIPNAEFHIYGEGSTKSDISTLIQGLGLEANVHMHPPVPIRQIASIMANVDLGVVPKRNDGFGGEAFSTKTLEFMATGVPVVISDTKVDKHYFDESVVRFFRAGDDADLARAIVEAYRDQEREDGRVSRALDHAKRNSWERRRGDYLAIVDRLLLAKRSRREN